jgi:hypothetical protein
MRAKASQLDWVPGLNSKKKKKYNLLMDNTNKMEEKSGKQLLEAKKKPGLLLNPYFNIGTNTPIYSNRYSCEKLVLLEFIFPPNSKNLDVK